jgi:hypothetical protein
MCHRLTQCKILGELEWHDLQKLGRIFARIAIPMSHEAQVRTIVTRLQLTTIDDQLVDISTRQLSEDCGLCRTGSWGWR